MKVQYEMSLAREALELIRDKRKFLKIDQKELAKAVGISRWTLSRLESGITNDVTVETLFHLARAVGLLPYLLFKK